MDRRNLIKGLAGAGMALPFVGATATARPSPDERIKAAMAEIEAAIAEMHPSFEFSTRNDFQRVKKYVPGGLVDGDPYCHAVLVYGYNPSSGRQSARWHREYV